MDEGLVESQVRSSVRTRNYSRSSLRNKDERGMSDTIKCEDGVFMNSKEIVKGV